MICIVLQCLHGNGHHILWLSSDEVHHLKHVLGGHNDVRELGDLEPHDYVNLDDEPDDLYKSQGGIHFPCLKNHQS